MESESDVTMIPSFDFCKGGVALEEGSEEWKEMSKKVREACEIHGCFFLMCDDKIIPKGIREEMFNGLKALFDLPDETKQQHISLKPYRGYNAKHPVIPLCESFGVDALSDSAQAFTNLMWPQGNSPFRDETLETMSLKMLELGFLVMKMIVESYDLPKHYISDVENMKSSSYSRLTKYQVPNNESETALTPHTDISALTILCENGVQGLQVLSKAGKWIELEIPQNGFVVNIGDVLKAWSNGRLHSVTHRVVMSSGDKERYSFGLFVMPKEEMDIEVPRELVDDIHPLRYHPFNYREYLYYYIGNPPEKALQVVAGL